MKNPSKIEVAVYMPDEQAQMFLLFQQHYDNISILLKSGVFSVRSGSVVLNFDIHGKLKTVKRSDDLYLHEHGYPQG